MATFLFVLVRCLILAAAIILTALPAGGQGPVHSFGDLLKDLDGPIVGIGLRF